MTPLRGATLGIFACAFIAILLRLMQVVPAANMVPHVLVAATMILALLTIVDESDQTS